MKKLPDELRRERQRERDRNKKARKRKKEADVAWQRLTNRGYFEKVWVARYNELREVLIADGWLREEDVHIRARVDEAVDALVAECFPMLAGRGGEYEGYDRWSRPRHVPDVSDVVCVKMTPILLDGLVDLAVDEEAERTTELNPATQRYEPGKVPPEFADRLRDNPSGLRRVLEEWLFRWCRSYVPEPISVPCHCAARLPECECESRFRFTLYQVGEIGRHAAPKPERPFGRKPLVSKRILYSGPIPRWWKNDKCDDDPIVRSHAKVTIAGMKGFQAGVKEPWRNPNAAYDPERDDRASTRDTKFTAEQGERELQKPYDDPEAEDQDEDDEEGPEN